MTRTIKGTAQRTLQAGLWHDHVSAVALVTDILLGLQERFCRKETPPKHQFQAACFVLLIY
jgi:hypothetical protein